MNADAPTLDIDPETLTLLRENGIDPSVYLRRRQELAAFARAPGEDAALRAEQQRFRDVGESLTRGLDKHGLWSDGLRPW